MRKLGGFIKMDNIQYESLDEIDEIFHDIDTEIKRNFEKIPRKYKSDLFEIKRYLFHAKRSPLPLSNSFDSLKRWTNFTKIPIDIYLFISKIEDLPIIQEYLPNLPILIQDAAVKFTNKNPIYNKLQQVCSLLPKSSVILIVHEADRVKLKNIISDDTNFSFDVSVSTWNKLNTQIKDYYKQRKTIIAIEPPYSGDNIFSNYFENIRFLLNSESLEIIKDLISKMKIGHSHYPIYFSNNEILTPTLLKTMEGNLHLEKSQLVKTYISPDMIDDLKTWCQNEILKPTEKTIIPEQRDDIGDNTDTEELPMIQEKQEAIVAIENKSNTCIVFPLHSALYILGRGDKPIPAEELIGNYPKQPIGISTSKKGISIKVHFADWLVNDIDMGKIKRGIYEWDSFYDVLKDSIQWVEYLRNEAENYEDETELAKKSVIH